MSNFEHSRVISVRFLLLLLQARRSDVAPLVWLLAVHHALAGLVERDVLRMRDGFADKLGVASVCWG